MTPGEWLARVRHDLVKRLVWPARDRAIGAAVRRAKSQYPDVVVKTAPVYLGCIH